MEFNHPKISQFPSHDGVLYKRMILPSENLQEEGFIWMHLCGVNNHTHKWFIEQTSFDPLIINALLSEESRPRALLHTDGFLFNLRGINFLDPEAPEEMISLRMWICDGLIITVRRRDIKAISELQEDIANGNPPKSMGEFMTRITKKVYDRIDPFIDDLENQIITLEQHIAAGEKKHISLDISKLRKKNASFRHYIVPQKLALQTIIERKPSFLSPSDINSLTESLDNVLRYTEDLNDLKNRSQIITEEIRYLQAESLNKTTYLFSVAATIFLPLSFLTGLFGINIAGMPGVNEENAFYLFVIFCIAITIAQVIIFKKLKWF